MGEFMSIVEELALILEESKREGGVLAQDLPGIISRLTRREDINCYPGIPGHDCHELAFFISLSSQFYAKGRGHLTCAQAMKKIVQHMQGSCFQITHTAIFITDSWDVTAFDDWRNNLVEIKRNALFEIYLITGRYFSELRV
jgi:hypothetical protein